MTVRSQDATLAAHLDSLCPVTIWTASIEGPGRVIAAKTVFHDAARKRALNLFGHTNAFLNFRHDVCYLAGITIKTPFPSSRPDRKR